MISIIVEIIHIAIIKYFIIIFAELRENDGCGLPFATDIKRERKRIIKREYLIEVDDVEGINCALQHYLRKRHTNYNLLSLIVAHVGYEKRVKSAKNDF